MRESAQSPAPDFVWETLVDPHGRKDRDWLALVEDDTEPQVIESDRPHLVVWSSLWADRPRDQIRFVITGDGRLGSRLKWLIETEDKPPNVAAITRMRHRINYLINCEMRYSFGE